MLSWNKFFSHIRLQKWTMEPPPSPRSRQASTDPSDCGSTPARHAETASSRGQADQNLLFAQAVLGVTGVERPTNRAPQFEPAAAQRTLADQIHEGILRLASLSAEGNYLFRPGGNIPVDEAASALLRASIDPPTSLLSLRPPSASIPRLPYPPSRNLTGLESLVSELAAARSIQNANLSQPSMSLSNPGHHLAGTPQRFDQATFSLPSALLRMTGLLQDRHVHGAVEQPMSGVAGSILELLGSQAFQALAPASVSLPSALGIPQPNEAVASLNLSGLHPTGAFPAYSQETFSPPGSRQIPQYNESAALNLSRVYNTEATTMRLPMFALMPEPSESKDTDDDDDRKPSASKKDDWAPQSQQAATNLMGVNFPSERSSLNLREGCNSPREAYRILKILGSTLRSKTDPFVDVAALPEPHGQGMKRMIRGSDRFFPDELHSMLLEVEKEGLYTEAVSFLPHGRAFRVHKRDIFTQEVLPRYFGGKGKWASFLRQLKLYGFLRVSEGKDCDAHYHELFLKTRPELIQYMRRVGTPKGLDRRTFRPAEGEDPDFYSLPPLTENELEDP